MGLFDKKPKVVLELQLGTKGHVFRDHNIDADTIANKIRCVIRKGVLEGREVELTRIFKLSDVQSAGIEVTGWETFDEHPELILLEGYRDIGTNVAHLQRKKP